MQSTHFYGYVNGELRVRLLRRAFLFGFWALFALAAFSAAALLTGFALCCVIFAAFALSAALLRALFVAFFAFAPLLFVFVDRLWPGLKAGNIGTKAAHQLEQDRA